MKIFPLFVGLLVLGYSLFAEKNGLIQALARHKVAEEKYLVAFLSTDNPKNGNGSWKINAICSASK